MYDPVSAYSRSGSQSIGATDSKIDSQYQAHIGLGICLGASTISAALLMRPSADSASQKRPITQIIRQGAYPHEGDPKQTLLKVLSDFNPSGCDRIAITGRRLREGIDLSSISEPEAVGYAYHYLKPPGIDCSAIVSAGGETFMVYALDPSGEISNVITGNKCASGTGEFFLQQLRRMNVSLEEASQWSETEIPYPVSGRCSVFCKSDCTHATNKGVPRARVAAGLCRMMAEKILDLLKNIPRRNIMLVGGTANNRMMIAHLRKHIDNLIIPDQAPCFEALGAALWALDHPTKAYSNNAPLFVKNVSSFNRLPKLADFKQQVTFKTIALDTAQNGDVCLLGLDVGSTTTKAVLIRHKDHALLASVYLRTNGDPVAASRKCYSALLDQIKESATPQTITIIGLGVCGSGRQIAGLHAQTEGVINEIIAHTTAAVHFDPDVDTLFEIGGQDAKYTHITAGVASDYAMNEACSAGTGSFLEESALETLGIHMQEIADYALGGDQPPNFNDQCAAFISSDIKNAIHEGIQREDIVAGLVYSVCMNYTNRVKGNRPVGGRIFMQGGVCYNRAVPMAMAALVGKPIVVPPEPGLMGAFGVALEVEKRMQAGLMDPGTFDLQVLTQRQATYGKSFICRGGGSGCDRRCEIAMVRIEGKNIPFGGACNRYYNLHKKIKVDADALDLVKKRQDLFLGDAMPGKGKITSQNRPTVGINRSFLFHSYFPLYATFFEELGFDVRVPDSPSQRGIAERSAAFCYPAELSHGFFHRLIGTDPPPDYLFLPHIKALPSQSQTDHALLCPFVQAEPYFLQTTFRRHLEQSGIHGDRVLSPVLSLSGGLDTARAPLLKIARQMGRSRRRAAEAFKQAVAAQRQCEDEIRQLGKQAMQTLSDDPRHMAVVVFGRPYNAWSSEAHMGIPRKLASRGVPALPLDCLPLSSFATKHHMYWAMGQRIIQAARLVKNHPQLFGVYITNFSCGPDSFIINYFRRIMGQKPSLTLELDSHTADAGLETRIEAFLDVVNAWRGLQQLRQNPAAEPAFTPARVASSKGRLGVHASSGNWLPLSDDRVTLLFPSMGRLSSEALAAAFASRGIRSVAARPSDEAILKRGRANTACKECLPLILTTGTLLEYLHQHHDGADNVLIYFMATGAGPCRFGQYRIFMEDLIRDRKIENVALFSLNSENGYSGLDRRFHLHSWQAVVIADVMEDARSMLLANAKHPDAAMHCFEKVWKELVQAIESGRSDLLDRQLTLAADTLKDIDLKQPAERVPTLALVGEIFVRRDGISRQYITERLAQMGFACTCAPVAEWIHYADWLVKNGYSLNGHNGWSKKIGLVLKQRAMRKAEMDIKQRLARSGLIHPEMVDIPDIIRHAHPHITPDHLGEAILTVGSALKEVVSTTCGVVSIGPFGCMPNRIAESILGEIMTADDKLRVAPGDHWLQTVLKDVSSLPFLSIESDGAPFPQIITSKLEAFCLRARQLHDRRDPSQNNG